MGKFLVKLGLKIQAWWCLFQCYWNIHCAGCRDNTGLIARHLILKGVAFFEFYNVEVVQWNQAVFDIHDWLVLIFMRGDMHLVVLSGTRGAGMRRQEILKLGGVGHCGGAARFGDDNRRAS